MWPGVWSARRPCGARSIDCPCPNALSDLPISPAPLGRCSMRQVLCAGLFSPEYLLLLAVTVPDRYLRATRVSIDLMCLTV